MSSGTTPLLAGCAAFGLDDMSFGPIGVVNRLPDLTPACVILPGHPNGAVLTGSKARKERVHTGLPWPLDARVKIGEHLRRAPVCCVWRALVEARDSQARWDIGGGVSFPLARILAVHIVNQLVSEKNNPTEMKAAVAIPDDLDEYGQESLLGELRRECEDRKIRAEVRLLWRPVAAALSWLDKAGGDMTAREVKGNPDNFFLVLYFGPDAIECVPFKLRVLRQGNNDFILPRRERPVAISSHAGYDWVANGLASLPKLRGKESEGAFWQAFACFPEPWQIVAGRGLNEQSPPRIWGMEQGYDLWDPKKEDFTAWFGKAPCDASWQVRELLKNSCSLRESIPSKESWPVRLASLVRTTLNKQRAGQLVGMTVCGPLAPEQPPGWLRDCFAELEARRLDISGPWDTRKANRLWMSPGSEAIAQGAAIFLQRLQRDEPTYLDTLPQYHLLYKSTDKSYTTSPLVDKAEIEGGQEYTKDICQRFIIEKDARELDIVIALGGGHEELLRQSIGVDRLDYEVGRDSEGLSIAQASLVRHLVRTSANQDNARKRVELNLRNIGNQRAALDHARSYSELWFGKSDGTASIPQTQQHPETPFRKLTFPFPLPSPQEMPVDLHVRIRPASGMARMEVIPKDAAFLYGRRVFADYRTMRACPPEDLLTDSRGWPPLEELAPHPDRAIWRRERIDDLVDKFESAYPLSRDFNDLLDKMYNFIKSPKLYVAPVGGEQMSLPVLSQEGLAGCQDGQRLIDRFRESLQKHSAGLPTWDSQQAGRLITRATWLYAVTPQNVTDRIKKEISARKSTNRTIEAGSRALIETKEISTVFDRISQIIRVDRKFVIQNIRACRNILTLRKNGQDALTDETANTLLDAVSKVIDHYAKDRKYQSKFFAGIKLLLYLLRFRKRNMNFLAVDSEETDKIKDKLEGYLIEMKRCMRPNRYAKANEIITGTIDYLNFVGKTDFLSTLTEWSGGDDDGNNND